MQWLKWTSGLTHWRRPRSSAWGALLDRQEILLVHLALQQSGGVRVVVFEHLQVPAGLVHPAERDDWLVQTLRGPGAQWAAHLRTMALALGEDRCRQGVMAWDGASDARRLALDVQQAAAAAWGVEPEEVGFDFQQESAAPLSQVRWAACLREELLQWRQHARRAGWRLPLVEPASQAVQRAARCWRDGAGQQWAESPQDWQFDRTPERGLPESQLARLHNTPMYKPLAACGAALGALL